MPGLYLHIPFCKQACHYCNFHFSTSLKYKAELLEAIKKEIFLQRDYLNGEALQTIYLGGGTPSLLSADELNQLFEAIGQSHSITTDAEVTLEANPDDLSADYLKSLRSTPVNRLSIGIQSFFDEDLEFMNRAHQGGEARRCLEDALSAGFTNLTADLIYGTPGLSDERWHSNLDILLGYEVPHISSYCLTVEPNTALDYFVKKGKAPAVNEEQAARQFEILMQRMKAAGFIHYEISNFAREGHLARHNSNYWQGESYLGLGPSAHSFNGQSRRWNVANNAQYLKVLSREETRDLFEEEKLTPAQVYNEYVMTGLRTIWGCDLGRIKEMDSSFVKHFLEAAKPWLDSEKMLDEEGRYVLTSAGRLLADRIAMELFFEE